MTVKTLVIAVAIALAGGIAIGYFARPQPALHQVDLRHYEDDGSGLVQIHQVAGPERIVVRKFAAICPQPSPEPGFTRPTGVALEDRLVEETVTERGPTTTDTVAAARQHTESDRKVDLTITPPARPGWAFQAGVDDVLGAQPIRLELRRRLFAGAWVGIAAVPSRGHLGVSAALEF